MGATRRRRPVFFRMQWLCHVARRSLPGRAAMRPRSDSAAVAAQAKEFPRADAVGRRGLDDERQPRQVRVARATGFAAPALSASETTRRPPEGGLFLSTRAARATRRGRGGLDESWGPPARAARSSDDRIACGPASSGSRGVPARVAAAARDGRGRVRGTCVSAPRSVSRPCSRLPGAGPDWLRWPPGPAT